MAQIIKHLRPITNVQALASYSNDAMFNVTAPLYAEEVKDTP